MIQNSFDEQFNNSFICTKPKDNDNILCYEGNKILIGAQNGALRYPSYEQVKGTKATYMYLFSFEGELFFLMKAQQVQIHEFSFADIDILRASLPRYYGFAGMVGYHLHCWYRDHRFCARCSQALKHAKNARMLYCGSCGNYIFPTIAPAVIVAVTSGNKLLMTKYANRPYKRFTLVAGFTEIGEMIEDTVKREVMEEVGLKVKNLKYYSSQPWPFSGTLLLGFFAELDGSDRITLDEKELSEAVWVERGDINVKKDNISLTNEMINHFKDMGAEK